MKDINSGPIPVFKELSRSFPHSFDSDRTTLDKRSKTNPITAPYPNSGSPRAVIIERALKEIGFDGVVLNEIILISVLIPPICIFYVLQ